MQDKQKVTLYLPPDLHRQLKIRAAVESETMTALAERALAVYLNHSDTVDRVERHGHTHQIYSCPVCTSSLLVQSGELTPISNKPSSILSDEDLSLSQVYSEELRSNPEETSHLVPC